MENKVGLENKTLQDPVESADSKEGVPGYPDTQGDREEKRGEPGNCGEESSLKKTKANVPGVIQMSETFESESDRKRRKKIEAWIRKEILKRKREGKGKKEGKESANPGDN